MCPIQVARPDARPGIRSTRGSAASRGLKVRRRDPLACPGGRALDNVAIERFWRSLKYEEVYLKDYADLTEAPRQIGRYIERYNSFRPHQSLGGRTPDMVYAEGRTASVA